MYSDCHYKVQNYMVSVIHNCQRGIRFSSLTYKGDFTILKTERTLLIENHSAPRNKIIRHI